MINFVQQSTTFGTAAILFAIAIPGTVLGPYFAGFAVLAIELPITITSESRETPGLDRIVRFGPLIRNHARSPGKRIKLRGRSARALLRSKWFERVAIVDRRRAARIAAETIRSISF
jgi:hypothetical protein